MWRAALQNLLLTLNPNLKSGQLHVGKLAAKSKDFSDYCRKAIAKLDRDEQISISDEEIEEGYAEMRREYQDKLNCYYQLRSLFAPAVEGIILADRLAYLLEQVNRERIFSMQYLCLKQMF